MTSTNRSIRTSSKRVRNAAAGLQSVEERDKASTGGVENKNIPPLETPRVLNRNVITSLTHGLDASDVLECYSLVRSAPLHGIADSTITVQKMTIGIRFRPTAADLKNPYNVKTPMELTLEYGPARLGPALSDEATPIVHGNDESSSYLAWDNVGKVYFTQKIVAENFRSSHYMASMTGAVLNKLLHEAVEYTEKRTIYQPFAVYSDKGKQLLRSSSSKDFAWFVWSHLARLGVEIEPILPPSIYEARLYVKSAIKVFPDQSVTQAAATFYQKLYDCMESIASNNYGAYLSSRNQQPASIMDNKEDGTNNGTRHLALRSENDANDGNHRRKLADIDEGEGEVDEDRDDQDETEAMDEGEGEVVDEGEVLDEIDNMDEGEGEVGEDGDDQDEMEVIDEDEGEVDDSNDDGDDNGDGEEVIDEDSEETEIENSGDNSPATLEQDDEENTDPEPEVSEETSQLPSNPLPSSSNQETASTLETGIGEPSSTISPTPVPSESIRDVEKAQNAAYDAQKAADDAKNAAHTEGETKAADAAQAAADAAQAAADATSSAASQAAKDSLLSEDGAMMSTIISTCFSNPRYEISSADGNGTTSTEIYLFRDPSSYYKLELTSPYLEIVKLNRELPNAATLLSGSSAGGDALDWTLALSIVFLLFLTVLLICQQMGKHYIEAIYKCQRWYFNPRKHDYEGQSISGVQSGSHFFFGESGIPISMGGRRSSYSPLNNQDAIQDVIVDKPYKDDDGDIGENGILPMSPDHLPPTPLHKQRKNSSTPSREVEMTSFTLERHNHTGPVGRRNSNPWRENSDSSGGSVEGDEIVLDIPERFLRNPDLVDMPSLKSKSKVAIPVGSNGPYSSTSSFAEVSVNSAI
mmetsp:Transcript_13353/g.31229  ORF Transcript_13353/g.31229 Transcript_13353/m.31229 type:complete len:867 (-) Transcript_13353:33-2633(-)